MAPEIVLARKKRHGPLLHLPHGHHLLELFAQFWHGLCLDSSFHELLLLFLGFFCVIFRVVLGPGFYEFLELLIVGFFTEIVPEMFPEFGDRLELDHDFLVVASALGCCSIAQVFR